MHVVIVGDEIAFPRGFAATGYVRLFARALVTAGASAHVAALDYSERGAVPLNTEARGEVDGVTFEYTTGATALPTRPLAIPIGRARSHARFFADVLARARARRLDAVLYYGRSTAELLHCLAAARAAGVAFGVVVVEWRLAYRDQTRAQVVNDRLFARALGLVDGAVVISRFLVDRVTPLLPAGAPVLRLPILAEPAAWIGTAPATRPTPYAVLCTDFDSYPDDAVAVVRAAARLAPRSLELLFVGKASARTRERLRAEARALPAGVALTLRHDYVATDELRSLYAGAAALVALLPDDDRSRARFPSKIAEYLLSGRPVVSTRVGEVAEHLRDGESAYLAAPGDEAAFAAALARALDDPEASAVGERGRAVALRDFDYECLGPSIVGFVDAMVARRRR
ncbi:MAG: glycosyl transferase group 1 [Myxococcaceae bacterium]|nr:glycosyl transferase group 1 [Myxococcaceae bacterium]